MPGGQRLQLRDHVMRSTASDFGFGTRDVDKNPLLVDRSGQGLHEIKVAQVLENRATPLAKRGQQVLAGLLETRVGRGLHAGIFLGDEAAKVVLIVADGQLIARRCAGQYGTVDARVAHQPTQIRNVGMQRGPRSRRRPLIPCGTDERVDAHRSIRIDDQHRQHRTLLRCAQRQRFIAHAHLQRAQYAELGRRKGPPRAQSIGHHDVSALTRFAS
jgi:hypothetical protein